MAPIMAVFSTGLYTAFVYNLCGHTLRTDISVLIQLFKIPWSVEYPNVKDPNRKLSETPPVKRKNSTSALQLLAAVLECH